MTPWQTVCRHRDYEKALDCFSLLGVKGQYTGVRWLGAHHYRYFSLDGGVVDMRIVRWGVDYRVQWRSEG